MEHVTETGVEIDIIDGKIESGRIVAKRVELLGEKVEFDRYRNMKDVEKGLLGVFRDKYMELKGSPLLQTDLRNIEGAIVNEGTQKAKMLQTLAKYPCMTSKDMQKRCDVNDSSVSTQLTEMRRLGLIAILSTDGNKRYKYVITHVGAREAVRLSGTEPEVDDFEGYHPME